MGRGEEGDTDGQVGVGVAKRNPGRRQGRAAADGAGVGASATEVEGRQCQQRQQRSKCK